MKLFVGLTAVAVFTFLVGQITPVMAETKNRSGIVVWKLVANQGVMNEDVNLISNYVANQVDKYSGSKVISESDIHTILMGEEKRQECGVEDTSCLVEIGAALGVPEAVSGDIGRLGAIWMLNLRRINVRTAEVVSRSSRQVTGDIDSLVVAIPFAVAELFGVKLSDQPGSLVVSVTPNGSKVVIDGKTVGETPLTHPLLEGNYTVEVSRSGYFSEKRLIELKPGERTEIQTALKPVPFNPYRTAAYATFFSGVGLVAFGGIATWQAKEAGDNYNFTGKASDERKSHSWTGAAIAGYSLGAAAMITGVTLWVLDPGDSESTKKQTVSVVPGPDGRGMAVTLSGRW